MRGLQSTEEGGGDCSLQRRGEGTAVYRGGGRGLQSTEEGGGDCSLQRRGRGLQSTEEGGGDCSLHRRGEGTALHVTVEQHMLRALLLHCTVTFCKCPWALTMHVGARGGWALTRVLRPGRD